MVSENFWGQSLHMNLNGCDNQTFEKENLKKFCKLLCKEIKMKPYGKAMVERFGSGKLKGNSALQFIHTSSISIHTDEFFDRVFIDIFSCKKFDEIKAKTFSKKFFLAKKVNSKLLNRF
ncbi:MAG: S-adenosylmethionine decarboxylase [Nanoarchaeota archaeon]|nr:S-adenosylmethionine decarboxylase [Nanoarchaeota archaeon]